MNRNKSCDPECKLKQSFGQSCEMGCQMLTLTDSVFEGGPLVDWLKKKGWK